MVVTIPGRSCTWKWDVGCAPSTHISCTKGARLCMCSCVCVWVRWTRKKRGKRKKRYRIRHQWKKKWKKIKINQIKRNQEYLLGRAWVGVRVCVRWVGVTLVQCGPVGYPAPVYEQDAVQEVFQKHFSNWFRADRATSRWVGTYGTVRCGVEQ